MAAAAINNVSMNIGENENQKMVSVSKISSLAKKSIGGGVRKSRKSVSSARQILYRKW